MTTHANSVQNTTIQEFGITEKKTRYNRFFMKLFNTSDIQTVTECQLIFGFKLPSAIIADKSKIFLNGNNLLFKLVLIDFVTFDACWICRSVDIDVI